MTADVFFETGVVVIEKVALVAPEATDTDCGTVAAELDEDRATVAPLLPAFDEIVTVPVEPEPPATADGDKESFLSVCAPDVAGIARAATTRHPIRTLGRRVWSRELNTECKVHRRPRYKNAAQIGPFQKQA